MARPRGKLWQADVRAADGKRLRPTFQTKASAEAWESAAKLAIEEGKPVPSSGTTPRRSVDRDLHLLGHLFDHVSRTEWANMRSGVSLSRNGRIVTEYFGRNKLVSAITAADIADMKADFADQGKAPGTVNRRVAALSKMLRIAKDNGIIGAIPRIRWNKSEKTKFRFLDRAEERALLDYWEGCGYDDLRDLTILLIDTGARCFSEMIPVKWDAFGPQFSSVSFWHTKTNQPRTVPLTKRARTILAARKLSKGNQPGPFAGINRNTMRSRWDNMRTALEMPDVTPHTMRHTCCTRLVLGGVDVKRVMSWMGHDAIVTTMRYMQIKPSSLEEITHILEEPDELADAA